MEMLVEFFLFMLQAALWYVIISFVAGLLLKRVEKEAITERDAMVTKLAKMIHQVKAEKHGDLYYWFDLETDQFLAQGRDDEEIRKHLLDRFKGHIFLLDDKKAMAGPDLRVMPITELTQKT